MNKLSCALIMILALGLSTSLHAQRPFQFGFRSGIGYANIDPKDAVFEGETYGNTFGFHVGMLFQYMVVKEFGVRAEFSYVQRGLDYTFEGEGYDIIRSQFANDLVVTGDKFLRIAHNNDYLDFPISLVFKPSKSLEINGGMYFSTLLSAKAAGRKTMTPTNPLANAYSQELTYNYNRDKFRQARGEGTQTILVNNNFYSIPTELGAYYDFDPGKEKMFRNFDYGWQVGASFYLNKSLFFGVKYLRGLTDAVNDNLDFSPVSVIDAETPNTRSRMNFNNLWQISIGFAF